MPNREKFLASRAGHARMKIKALEAENARLRKEWIAEEAEVARLSWKMCKRKKRE